MKIVIIHNIATSYYKNIVFNEFFRLHQDLKVIHLAETEKIRDWKVDLSDIEYPYKVIAKGSINNYSKIFFVKKIIQQLKKENPDIVYIGGYFHIATWVALIYAKLYGKKIILEMDSNKFDQKRVKSKEFIKRFFVKKCDVGLTYGEFSKQYFIELGMPLEKILIKPNVSSKTLFFASRDLVKPKLFTRGKHFIYVGRFSQEKNLLKLLENFHKARNTVSNDEWGLVLVGSGPQEDILRQYIQEQNIENVIFSGFVDKNDLKNYYNHANVFVLPSTREPWGLVVNEAMMCGLPVIVSNKCGCSLDLIKDNGYVFDPDSEHELQAIMESYMNNQEELKEQGRISMELISKFTPELASIKIVEAVEILKKQ